ncbi:MAG: glycosyltransferase family 2 protein [Lentisphaerae bacterium]|jgi:glycosyltransferase involved in cell wall biosynthesis|nr:glycosyltransferase family 2 protein [Lentisphaerota bacterium]
MSEVVPNLVSVVIPVRNRSRWLPDAVQSALNQSHSPVEILLCDDGSTDGTEKLVADLAARWPEQICALHLPPRGPGPAREAGRQAARGEFIQYLDSDDLLLPDKFSLQIAALRQHPECAIAYGMTRLVDEQNNILVSPFKWTGRELPQLFPGLLVDRWWCTHTPLYRRTLCDQIGPWSDLRYSQDWEYDARAGALNVQLAFVDQPVSHHRYHSGVRQTQHGKWLVPSDQVRFFTALFRAAQASGVTADAPEMKHFGRWVFAAARQVARRGDIAAAKTLLALAEECTDHSSRELQIYRRLSRVVGWRMTAIVSEWYKRTVSRGVGPDTLRQSWANHSHHQP